MKKRKFPQDVARFFHPEKSGSNANPETKFLGTHQEEKARERSCIVVVPGVGMNSRRYRRGSCMRKKKRNQRQGLTLAQKKQVEKIAIKAFYSSLVPSSKEVQACLLTALKGIQVPH